MKKLLYFFVLWAASISFPSHALLITDTRMNVAIQQGYDGFSTDMVSLGYNPSTDIVNSIRLSVRFREIDDDSDTDTPESDSREFVIFYSMLFGERMQVFPDIDNESFTFSRHYYPDKDTCMVWDEFDCSFDPVKTGYFGLSMDVSTSNLLCEEATWELDITRAHVNEPSTILLIFSALFLLFVGHYKRPGRAG